MKVRYDACLSLQQVYEWTRKLMNGTSSVRDSPRPGQAHNHLRERLCWLCATCADLLKNHLRPAIKSKRHGLLSTGVLLQHENARPHTTHSTVATIQDLSFDCLPQPPYSPDLVFSDFRVSRPLKEAMGGKSFRSDEEVRQAVHEWLRSQPKDFFFFSRGIHALPKRWNTCMVCNGDYVEKWSHCVPLVFNKLRDKKIFKDFTWLTYVVQELGNRHVLLHGFIIQMKPPPAKSKQTFYKFILVVTLRTNTFCPHIVFMCFVWIAEQTAIISLYSVKSPVFITEQECSQHGTEWVYIIRFILKSNAYRPITWRFIGQALIITSHYNCVIWRLNYWTILSVYTRMRQKNVTIYR